MVQKYLNKISGPLLDRIDLHVEVTPASFNELSGPGAGNTSAEIRKRVVAARGIQTARYKHQEGVYCNAMVSSGWISEFSPVDRVGLTLLKNAMNKLNLSARAYDRILKVSRTIADLDAEEHIRPEHIAEAIQYRSLDRENWAR